MIKGSFNKYKTPALIPHVKLKEAFLTELRSSLKQGHYDRKNIYSVYFGGGTPSMAEPALVESVLDELNVNSAQVEVTLECNPTDVNINMLKAFKNAGVNRISLGMQSLNDTLVNSVQS